MAKPNCCYNSIQPLSKPFPQLKAIKKPLFNVLLTVCLYARNLSICLISVKGCIYCWYLQQIPHSLTCADVYTCTHLVMPFTYCKIIPYMYTMYTLVCRGARMVLHSLLIKLGEQSLPLHNSLLPFLDGIKE